jgi:hypothetical protein
MYTKEMKHPKEVRDYLSKVRREYLARKKLKALEAQPAKTQATKAQNYPPSPVKAKEGSS